eukprot:g23262.t2
MFISRRSSMERGDLECLHHGVQPRAECAERLADLRGVGSGKDHFKHRRGECGAGRVRYDGGLGVGAAAVPATATGMGSPGRSLCRYRFLQHHCGCVRCCSGLGDGTLPCQRPRRPFGRDLFGLWSRAFAPLLPLEPPTAAAIAQGDAALRQKLCNAGLSKKEAKRRLQQLARVLSGDVAVAEGAEDAEDGAEANSTRWWQPGRHSGRGGYHSAFGDTDGFFGSRGSFFESQIQEGVVEVNPPFDEALVLRTADVCQRKKALVFLIIIPETDWPGHRAFEESKFKKWSLMLDCLKFSEAEIEYVKTFQNSIRVHEPAGPPAPQAESSAIVLLDRAHMAKKLLDEGTVVKVIVSGADPAGVGHTEASLTAHVLTQVGVPLDAILQESQATTTAENAWFMLRWIPKNTGRVVIITSDFHMARATYIFQERMEGVGIPDWNWCKLPRRVSVAAMRV